MKGRTLFLKELEEKELKNLQEEFYEYFKTGFEFEEFLKEYLMKIGLDEVEITQRTKDGGIDLKAKRYGIGNWSEIDTVNYYIQAKRYNLENKIRVQAIRELRGVIQSGERGIIISTSDFTGDAIKEAQEDKSRPIIVINGKLLVQSCIDNGIGFVFRPIFSNEQMNRFINQNKDLDINIGENPKNDYIEKTISINDIRARIISIPSSIRKLLSNSQKKINVLVNNDNKYELTINHERGFLSGVTEIFRKNNLLSKDNVITSKNSKWYFDKLQNTIELIIEN